MDDFLKDITPFFYRKHIQYVDVGANGEAALKSLETNRIQFGAAHLIGTAPAGPDGTAHGSKPIGVLSPVTLHAVILGEDQRNESGHTAERDNAGREDDVSTESAGAMRATTLDSLAADFEDRHISLLRIGAEMRADRILGGARRLLKANDIDVIYLEGSIEPGKSQHGDRRAVEDLLVLSGYRVFRVYRHEMETLGAVKGTGGSTAFMSRRFIAENPARLTQDFYAVDSAKNAVERANADAREKLEKALAQADFFAAQLETERRQRQEAEAERQALALQVDDLKAGRSALSENLQQARTQLETLNQAVLVSNRQAADFDAERNRLKQAAQALKEDLVIAEKRSDALDRELERRDTQTDALRDELISLKSVSASDLAAAKTETGMLRGQLAALQSRGEQLSTEYTDALRGKGEIEGRLEGAQSEITRLRAMLEEAEAQRRALYSDIDQNARAKTAAELKLLTTEHTVERLTAELTQSKRVAESSTAQLEDLKAKHLETLEKLSAAQSAPDRLRQLETDHAQVKAEHAEALEKLSAAQATADALKQLETDHAQVKAEHAEALEKLTAAQATAEALRQLEANHAAVKDELEAVGDRLRALQDSSLRNESEIGSRVALMEAELADSLRDSANLTAENEALLQNQSLIRRELERAQESLKKLEAEGAMLRRQLRDAEAPLASRSAAISELQRQLAASRQTMSAMERRLSASASDIAKRSDEIRALRRDIDRQAKELKAAGTRRQELTKLSSALTRDRESMLKYASLVEGKYDAILQSTSWKLTAPVRGLIAKLRSARNGGVVYGNTLPPRPKLTAEPYSRDFGSIAPIRKADPVDFEEIPADQAFEYADDHSAAVSAAKRDVVNDASQSRLEPPPSLSEPSPNVPAKEPEPAFSLASMPESLRILYEQKPRDEGALRREYVQSGLDRVPDTFALYRVVGNDLYPRHEKGQSRKNVQFILENEAPFPNCQKFWILNRIFDHDEEIQIIKLLEDHGQDYIRLPFSAEEYLKIGLDTEVMPDPAAFKKLNTSQRKRAELARFRLKNLYVMNNNGARNVALRSGKTKAKWVLPFDGNGFISLQAWKQIAAAVAARPYLKHFLVPMERIADNSVALATDYAPNAVEEPQIIFRKDTRDEFNEAFCYGRRPKVEMLWHLGVPGIWDTWKDDPWDQPRRSLSQEANSYGVAGWVFRLASGMAEQELPNRVAQSSRFNNRQDAIILTLEHISETLA